MATEAGCCQVVIQATGCEKGVMRTTMGSLAASKTWAAKRSFSSTGRRPGATALMQRARLALPGL
jgi:hypothetical protein